MEVRAEIVRLYLAETFVISRESQDWADVVHVDDRARRHRGQGRGGADRALRRDRRESRSRSSSSTPALVGDDPFALEEIGAATRGASGRAGGEMRARRGAPRPSGQAARDARQSAARRCRASGRRRRGRSGSATRTTWRVARRTAAPRFRRLKLKLGGGDGLDVERVRAVRARDRCCRCRSTSTSGGPSTRRSTPVGELAELGVEYVEQPLREGDRGGAELKRRSPIPVYVDEDCHTLADVAACQEVAHGINIKLAKSGGIREAMRMAHAARALGLGRHARLHDRVGPRDRRRLRRRAALRPRRPRREPAARARPGAGSVVRRRRPGRLRGAGAWLRVSGRSSSPRGSRPILTTGRRCAASCATGATTSSRSSTRRARARATRASPSSATSTGALAVGPEVAIVGVATQGGRFPPAWRDILRACIANGLSIENGLHEMLADDPELRRARRRRRRRAAGPSPAARRVSTARPGANLEVDARIVLTVGSDCAIGKMTVSARARPGGTGTRARVALRPDRADGDRDRGLGDLGRCRRGRLHLRRRRAARDRGTPARRRAVVGRGTGLARPPCVLGCHARALPRVAFRTRSSSVTGSGSTEIEGSPGHPDPAARRARRAARADGVAPPAGTRRRARAQHRRSRRREARQAVAAAADETGLPAADPVRDGADALLDAVLASLP